MDIDEPSPHTIAHIDHIQTSTEIPHVALYGRLPTAYCGGLPPLLFARLFARGLTVDGPELLSRMVRYIVCISQQEARFPFCHLYDASSSSLPLSFNRSYFEVGWFEGCAPLLGLRLVDVCHAGGFLLKQTKTVRLAPFSPLPACFLLPDRLDHFLPFSDCLDCTLQHGALPLAQPVGINGTSCMTAIKGECHCPTRKQGVMNPGKGGESLGSYSRETT